MTVSTQSAWHAYWESKTIREIKSLHVKAAQLAYELGREVASQGREKRPRFDICEPLDEAFIDGWNYEMRDEP